YVAPELLDGAQPDPRADVYSLGIVCYQALAGVPPYTGPAPLAVIRAADHGVHQPLAQVAGVPAPLAAVVEQAMHRDPGQRFPTAHAVPPGPGGGSPPGRGRPARTGPRPRAHGARPRRGRHPDVRPPPAPARARGP